MALIPWWIRYPNVNDEILNLDWLIKTMKEYEIKIDNFINLNTIKYADPILWDITSQYEANTVVVDPQTGDAYISVQPVPVGVILSNTDYWTKIFNYADSLHILRTQIAAADEELSPTATSNRAIGDLVWLDGYLYYITAAMITGDAYVVGSNCVPITIEDLLRTLIINIGNLADLQTTDKTSIVNAINEVVILIGDLDNLTTIDKSSIVNAINELDSLINNVYETIGVRSLQSRNFLIIGDSYADEPGEWPAITQSLLGLGSDVWHNEAISGSGFVSDGTLLFKNQLINYAGDKSAITDIFVCGGLNDSFYSDISNTFWTTLNANIADFNNYVKTNYPNAKIHLGYIGNGNDTSAYIGTRTYASRQMCKYFYLQAAQRLGWYWIDNVEFALCYNAAMIGADGVHPSSAGSSALALALAEYIVKGYTELKYPASTVFSTGFTGNNDMTYEADNGIGHIHCDNTYIAINQSTVIQGSFTLGMVTPLYFNKSLHIDITLQFRNFNSSNIDLWVPARLQLAGNVAAIQLLDETTYTADASAYIYINPFDMDFPISYCI